MRFPASILCLMLWTVGAAQDCEGPPPRKETEILSGVWSDPTYPQGTKASYKCRPGYRTYGTITMECKNGQWVNNNPSKTCQKKPCGHPGDIPFGSFDLVVGERFEYGARVVYTCDEGYQMIGDMNFRECEADGWTNDTPLCVVVKCLPMTEPANGRIATDTISLDQEYSFGQVIKFECNSGFMLDGPKVVHCLENGVWSGEKPRCVEISCQRPNIVYGEPVSPKNSYKENERLQYRCLPGYSYTGRADTVCTQLGWSPPPACKEVTCDPPRIANSHYSPDRDKYRLGHVITYTCKQGFYHPTRGNTARCTTVGWEPPPRCSFKPCDFPEIKHGYLHNERTHRPYFPVPVGKWFYYSCNENYVTSSEWSWDYITCKTDGWSPEVPCRRKCFFDYLENGNSPRYRTKYLQGDSVRVTCHAGYSLPGQQTTMTCTESGWAPPPNCIRVVTCSKSDLKIENGFISESESTYLLHKEAKYKCKAGYVTEDGHTSGSVTCLQRGWSTRPRCVKSCDMPAFENAKSKSGGTWFKVNDRLDYECQDGYKNRGGESTGFIVCGNDGWSDTPTCHEKECIVPDIEPNLIAQPQKEKYTVGDVLKFSCRRRHKLVGPDSVQCYNFGWSPDPPACKEKVKSCGLHPQLPHGNATKAPKEKYEHGEVVEYVCNPGFLLKGSRKIQCVDGEWTTLPQCIEEKSTCGEVPELHHGYVNPHDPPFQHGESVELNCTEGFTMIGDRSVTCIRGKWTPLPQCIATDNLKQCKLSRSNEYEIIQSEWRAYTHNEKINYTCKRKAEQKHSVCVNGRWVPEVTCTETPRCPPPPQIPRSQNMTTTVNYQEGEKLSILCQDNSLIQDTEEMVCQAGIWKSIPRCIEKTPCSQPPNIEHGTVRGSRPEEEGEEAVELKPYAHGTTLGYACEDGFELLGREEVSCSLGRWSHPPQCVGLPCEPPPVIANEAQTQRKSSYQHGEEFTYRCAREFRIHGSASVACSGGKWLHIPDCKKTTCTQPPTFDNAIPSKSIKASYKSGDEVAYKCQNDYQMDGSNVVLCRDGEWIGTPTCRDTSCGSPPIVENASIQNRKNKYLSGDAVYYKCIPSMDPFGETEVTCLNGNWTKPPQCKESGGKCGPPPTIDNGDTTTFPAAAYAPGMSVEYQCQAYYELQGDRIITCRDGRWSDPPKCLDACVISEGMMEKHHIKLKWRYEKKIYSKTDDYVEFICQDGYRPGSRQTEFRVKCQEGKLVYPTCI